MKMRCNISSVVYEAPSVTCCTVLVEKGYLTSKRGDIENLGDIKEEGEW